MKFTYKGAREDYEYLVEHHKSSPYDLTGGYVDGEEYEELLKNPTKENAKWHYLQLINYSSTSGFEGWYDAEAYAPDTEDRKTMRIYKKYGCEVRNNFHRLHSDRPDYED
jgi:hypothetical protein